MQASKTSSLILAAAALMGSVSPNSLGYDNAPLPRSTQRGRVGGNQRQKRLDRRRAHAAGKRNAFA